MTQCEMILNHLKENPNGITPYEALRCFGCLRLASRISDLRKEGYDIVSEMETKNGKTYCRYKLA